MAEAAAVEEALTEQAAEEIQEDVKLEDEIPTPEIDIEKAADKLAENLFGKKAETSEEVVEEEPEKAEEIEEEVKEETEEEKREAPQSWKKEMRDAWNSLDSEVQDYIELREQQMKDGVELRKDDAELGMKIRDVFTPYESLFRQHGVDATNAFQRLLGTHYALATAPVEKRKELFTQLAQSYGITEQGEPENADPQYQKLKSELDQIKQGLSVAQQRTLQEAQTRINEEVTKFASEHTHFDDLADEIAKLIRADYSLDDAYEMAYNNSVFKAKDDEKKAKEEQEKKLKAKKEEAEKVEKAKSVNVRNRDTGKAPTAPIGTMEDTMRETMRQIKNRN